MPGIAGWIRLEDRSTPTARPDKWTGPQTLESDYCTCSILSTSDVHAAVFAPPLSFPVAGSATDPASGISAGYYGEFFGPEFAGRDGTSIALRLAELYREKGAALPASLNGSFVAFIWNARTREGILFNDHYASRPVCYLEQNGVLHFSAEPKEIAGRPGVSVSTDETALLMMLNYGHLLSDSTYYRQIRYLAPGSVIRFSQGACKITRYFEYQVNESGEGVQSPELIEGFSAVLRQAIQRRLHHLPHFVIPISGGYDSRAILAAVRAFTDARPKTVSWGTDEDTPGADADIGRQVANFCGSDHYFLRRDFEASVEDMTEIVARVDGGTVDAVFHAVELKLMRKIRYDLGTDYLLRGDENFGYVGDAQGNAEALAWIGLRSIDQFPGMLRLLNPARKDEFRRMANQALEEADDACALKQPNSRKDYHYFYQRIRNCLNRCNYYKLTVLEATNPWMDRDVVEFVGRLPAAGRVDKGLFRQTMAAMFPELMQRVPMASRNSLENLGDCLHRSAPLQKFLRHQLLERRNRLHEIVDLNSVRNLLDAAFDGRQKESAGVALYLRAKQTLRKLSPALYRVVRSQAQGRAVIAELPPAHLVFRLLVMSLACDRLP